MSIWRSGPPTGTVTVVCPPWCGPGQSGARDVQAQRTKARTEANRSLKRWQRLHARNCEVRRTMKTLRGGPQQDACREDVQHSSPEVLLPANMGGILANLVSPGHQQRQAGLRLQPGLHSFRSPQRLLRILCEKTAIPATKKNVAAKPGGAAFPNVQVQPARLRCPELLWEPELVAPPLAPPDEPEAPP